MGEETPSNNQIDERVVLLAMICVGKMLNGSVEMLTLSKLRPEAWVGLMRHKEWRNRCAGWQRNLRPVTGSMMALGVFGVSEEGRCGGNTQGCGAMGKSPNLELQFPSLYTRTLMMPTSQGCENPLTYSVNIF